MNITQLTIGGALLMCVLAVMGLHAFQGGKAQREALVDRLSTTGEIHVGGRRRRFKGVDRRVRKLRLGKGIERRLATTGLDVSPGEYVIYALGALIGMYFVFASVFAPFFGLVADVVGLWGAKAYLDMQRVKRTEAFVNQLPELSRLLANATQAGLALRTAIGMAAEELDDPARAELRAVADRLAVGHTLDDALNELVERLPSRELTVLVSTLVLSNRAGGTIVSSLRNLTTTLEERKETRREVKTLLSQVKITAVAVPCMGLVFLLIINSIRDGALHDMTEATFGKITVIVAAGLYALGFLIISRIAKIRI